MNITADPHPNCNPNPNPNDHPNPNRDINAHIIHMFKQLNCYWLVWVLFVHFLNIDRELAGCKCLARRMCLVSIGQWWQRSTETDRQTDRRTDGPWSCWHKWWHGQTRRAECCRRRSEPRQTTSWRCRRRHADCHATDERRTMSLTTSHDQTNRHHTDSAQQSRTWKWK